MTDVVPKEGYTTLQEAVERVAAGLADRHVFLKKNQKLLAHDFAGLFGRKPEVELQKTANPGQSTLLLAPASGDSDEEKLRKATLAWAKRQLAVWKLYEALQNDALVSFVRDPASGEMFRITAADWHGAALWRDTIIGGEVRALPGELIERYNNRQVLIETPALDAWLATAKEATTPPAVAECRDWLVKEMRASPNAKPQPKPHYQIEANSRFGVSRDGFNRIWTQAIKETDATVWAEAGRPEREKTNQ